MLFGASYYFGELLDFKKKLIFIFFFMATQLIHGFGGEDDDDDEGEEQVWKDTRCALPFVPKRILTDIHFRSKSEN